MNIDKERISVTGPASEGFDRMREMLFEGFSVGKWFVVGFCAWLATLGQGNFNLRWGNFGGQQGQGLGQIPEQYVALIIGIAIGVGVVALVLTVVGLWAKSRGIFMFTHCIGLDVAEVKFPWREYKHEGNTLFVFKLIVGVITFVFGLVMAGIIAGIIMASRGGGDVMMMKNALIFAGLGLLFLPIFLVLTLVQVVANDYVSVIMYTQRMSCMEAWGVFKELFRGAWGKFVLFILFKALLGIGVGIAVVLGMCILCCLIPLLMLPYIGTVILLPVPVFFRAMTMEFMAQFGDEFNSFAGSGEPIEKGPGEGGEADEEPTAVGPVGPGASHKEERSSKMQEPPTEIGPDDILPPELEKEDEKPDDREDRNE